MQEPMLSAKSDYEAPLLRLIAELPSGFGRAKDISYQFFERYRDRIPSEHLEPKADGITPLWYNRVAWARFELAQMGLMDSPGRGIWRITPAGRDWLAQHPDATHLSPTTRQQRAGAGPRGRTSLPRSKTAIPAGLTLDLLEQTRQAMPADQFQQIWGAIYQALLAEARAKAITTLTDSSLKERARKPVRRIHAFLNSRVAATTRPSPRRSATGSTSATLWISTARQPRSGSTSTRTMSTPGSTSGRSGWRRCAGRRYDEVSERDGPRSSGPRNREG